MNQTEQETDKREVAKLLLYKNAISVAKCNVTYNKTENGIINAMIEFAEKYHKCDAIAFLNWTENNYYILLDESKNKKYIIKSEYERLINQLSKLIIAKEFSISQSELYQLFLTDQNKIS